MKKQLLISAIALAAAGAANAQLSIYGLLDVSYGKSIGDDLNDVKADIHSGGDNGSSNGNSTSRFGLKGSTDVGGGVKANFKLESNGITSSGSVNDPFFGRQAWFGLSGGFGELRIGRQDSVAFQTMVDYDFNGASNGVSAFGYSLVAPWLPGRQSHSVQYISPTMGGFSAQVGFQPKGNQTSGDFDINGNPIVDRGDKSVFSFAGKYSAGALSVAATYQSKSDTTTKAFSSVAGSYDLGAVKLMAGYANGGKIADGGTGKGFTLGFNAPVGGINIGANFGKNSDDDYKTTAYEFWVNKEIFKNTIAYFEAGSAKNKNTDLKGTGYAAGLIYVF